jgi:hypothetical protein
MPTRRTLLTALIAAFVAVQFAVPAVMLFEPRPARFGWQMYSALPPVPEAWTVAANGAETPIDVDAQFAARRAELDYVGILRADLCRATGAIAVRIQLADRDLDETIACE